MSTATSCTVDAFHRDGHRIEMVPYGAEPRCRRAGQCDDCGVATGGWHHPGCDVQRCPACGRHLLSCGCRFDEDDFDEDDLDDFDFDDACEPFGVDGNGVPTERVVWGDAEVIVHRADYPDTDITTVRGIRCTTALRTMIDIAVEVDREQLHVILADCLGRGLFTLDDAQRRLSQPDMVEHRGAALVRRVLPPQDSTE